MPAASKQSGLGRVCGGNADQPPPDGSFLRRRQAGGQFALDCMHTVPASPQQGLSAGAELDMLDAAMDSVRLALDKGVPGIFNVAEPNEAASTRKAAEELGWRADFRLPA
ncbi:MULTISPECIES: hypothetical protein [unclassified Mesorhizobium]|uniref:hypothetical protein n=1 Tax=unclassified Mesorhizobium TaxID=325217 RepID=UPI0015E2C121|nr:MULTISPECIES: hypothetical protein [unclassified Mesorhizobium]